MISFAYRSYIMPNATFAAGCFWGVESRFSSLPGVTATAVGYMGGHVPEPSYEDVCSKTSGHAEVIQLEYDDQIVSYDALLDFSGKCTIQPP